MPKQTNRLSRCKPWREEMLQCSYTRFLGCLLTSSAYPARLTTAVAESAFPHDPSTAARVDVCGAHCNEVTGTHMLM